MSTLRLEDLGLTAEEAWRMMPPRERQALMRQQLAAQVRDKSYQLTPIGAEIAVYLRAKRKRLSQSSYVNWECILDKLARFFSHAELSELEPPAGRERIEEFMDHQWGNNAAAGYNRNLSVVKDFFRWCVATGRLVGDPAQLVAPARKGQTYRTAFSDEQCEAIIASAAERRDRLALRLLLHYGIRKGALQAIQFKHFDHQRRRLTIFTKGGKVRALPLTEKAFWLDLERDILDREALPEHYLLCPRKVMPRGQRDVEYPERPLSGSAAHKWWYARLAAAGIVPRGTNAGERMHKARHSAGQRVLDKTGNLVAVKSLLGHASIQTTGDIYVDHDEAALAATLRLVLPDEEES